MISIKGPDSTDFEKKKIILWEPDLDLLNILVVAKTAAFIPHILILDCLVWDDANGL